ncbi:hypothetical protein [Methanobrevibacter smithii]|uniref:hypothetical protein n=1 Tax=Methanobrevibacter smithii TaxID=2173 RepID=UPI0037DCA73C
MDYTNEQQDELKFTIEEVNQILSDGIINCSTRYCCQDGTYKPLTLSEAVVLVPDKYKTLLRIITFLNKDVPAQPEIWIYFGTSIFDWSNLDYWVNIPNAKKYTELSKSLSDESINRINADQDLRLRIDNEAINRANADADLSRRIDEIEPGGGGGGDYEKLQKELAQEIQDRIAGDQNLESQFNLAIQGLKSSLELQISGLSTKVDELSTKVDTIPENIGDIPEQVTQLETELGKTDSKVSGIETEILEIGTSISNISGRVSTTETDISELQTNLSDEVSQRTQKDQELQEALDSLSTQVSSNRPTYLLKGDYLNVSNSTIGAELAKDGGFDNLKNIIQEKQLVLSIPSANNEFYQIFKQKFDTTYIYLGLLQSDSTTSTIVYLTITNTYIDKSIRKVYPQEGGGSTITVDDALSSESENPVQNKVITNELTRISEKVFPLTISVSGGGTYEKGTSQTVTVRWIVKEGDDIVTPDSITVNDEPVTNTDTSKQFTNVTVNTTYTVKVTKGGQQKSGSTSVTFVAASYFGVVDADFTPTEETIKGLTTKTVKNTKSYTGTATLNNQKLCYAYPKSLGALSSIKDANNFDYINSYNRTEVNVNGEAYYVYTLIDTTSVTNFKQIYA